MIDGLRQPPEHHHVGRLQRGLGPVRHRADRRAGRSSYDPTRLVNGASGWTDRPGVGDVHDIHAYPGPGHARPSRGARPCSASSAGSAWASTATPGPSKTWGYRGTASRDELTRKYERLLARSLGPEGRREGPQRRRLHPDHRRRDRGQRPADLRPRGHQGRPRPGRGREPGRRSRRSRSAEVVVPTSQDRGADLALHDREARRRAGLAPTSTTRAGRKAPASSARKGTPGAVVRTELEDARRLAPPDLRPPRGRPRPSCPAPSSTTRTPRST